MGGEAAAELVSRHDTDGFIKGADRTVVKIRRSERCETETRDFEDVAMFFVPREVLPSMVGCGHTTAIHKVVAQDAEFLKHVPPDIRALVTGDAPVLFEQPVSCPLIFGEGIRVSPKELIESRIRCQERSFEGGQRVLDGGAR